MSTTPRSARGVPIELVDAGAGRRLDRFGPHLLDRPAPSADRLARADDAAWAKADARYERASGGRGAWRGPRVPAGPWPVSIHGLTLELRLTDTGQVGLFVEQFPMWRWIRRQIVGAGRPIALLNLFAYTGASTLSAAAAGAAVVHVDGSRAAVAWARRNAALSGLEAAPIRWIVEDAETFVRRELRRGNAYDAVVLDPPSYGHGPGGEAWRLELRIAELLRACAALTAGRRAFLLVTTHSPGFGPDRLARELAEAMRPEELGRGLVQSGPLQADAASGVRLPLGAYARWVARASPARPDDAAR